MEENEGECTTKAEEKKGSKKNSWQWAMHAWLYRDVQQTLKGRTFVGYGFSTEGTFISASVVPRCGERWGGVTKQSITNR